MHQLVTLDAVQQIFDEFRVKTIPKVSKTKGYNDSFKSIGFKTSNPLQQMGTLNFFVLALLVLVLLKIMIVMLRQIPIKCLQVKSSRLRTETVTNIWMRFVLLAFFEVALVVILTFI